MNSVFLSINGYPLVPEDSVICVMVNEEEVHFGPLIHSMSLIILLMYSHSHTHSVIDYDFESSDHVPSSTPYVQRLVTLESSVSVDIP